jgi:hypothetical protein
MSNQSQGEDALVSEIVREAEAYLAAQVTLATSADQRASVMASVFAASGTAIAAGLIAFVGDADRVAAGLPVIVGGVVSALLFLLGSGLCVWATLPVEFDLPGSQPENWKKDIERGIPLNEALAEQAQNYQGKISDNSAILRSNAKKFSWGARLGIAAPVLGLLIWAFISFCSPVGSV